MASNKFGRIRKDYEHSAIDEDKVPSDPHHLFESWMMEAIDSDVYEPTAMSLSTVSADGRPSSRMVLLKHFDPEGYIFYTNYESRKGLHIAANPYGALLFFWPEFERQVRIEGRIGKISREVSEAYFNDRPERSRVSAVISPQSRQIPGRDHLERLWDEYIQDLDGKDPEIPDHWGGYRLMPDYFEFWQGRRSRLHDRIIYVPEKEGIWAIRRLAP